MPEDTNMNVAAERKTALTVGEVINMLVALDNSSAEVGASFNNSSPFSVTDVTNDEESGMVVVTCD